MVKVVSDGPVVTKRDPSEVAVTTSKCPHGRTVGQTDNGTFVCLKCRGVEEERKRTEPVIEAAKRLVLALKPHDAKMAKVPRSNVEALVEALKGIK